MKQKFKYIAILNIAFLLAFTMNAQQVNTLYFLESAPMRHTINPAFQPVSNIYIGLSPISLTSFNFSNAISYSDFVYKKDGKTITALYPGEEAALRDKLSDGLWTAFDTELAILNFGFRLKEKGYIYVGINEKVQVAASLNPDILNILFSPDIQFGNPLSLSNSNLLLSAYTEVMLGYAHQLNQHWTIGAKLKYLYGNAHAGLYIDQMSVNQSMEQWSAHMQGDLYLSTGFSKTQTPQEGSTLFDIGQSFKQEKWQNYLKSAGNGVAVDFGFTYNPIDQIRLALSVSDLGFIYWNGYQQGVNGETVYSGAEYSFDDFKELSGAKISDSTITHLKDFFIETISTDGNSENGYARMLNCKLNAGFDANFWNNRIGVGIYSRTSFFDKQVYEEVTIGASFRPVNWFNFAASYSFINGRWNSMGVGINLMPYDGLSLTLVTDYLPFTYTTIDPLHLSEDEQVQKIPAPYKTNALNLTFGLNIVIGSNTNKRKDSDKDGVPDYLDMCPLTPSDVQVDITGCPLDMDGDGVPDYMDECANTSYQAYGLVNEHGCPIDSDNDGIPDYLDKCPDTPKEAIGYVDQQGCYMDTDKDGIPDFLDLCPDTPAEAIGYVDNNGCVVDTDMDGVPDYLDQCNDTPLAAKGYVDESGCLLDTDLDGVPDYLDQCPNTPSVDPIFVNQYGCLIDSDDDSVPDYLDLCPNIIGSSSNNGCPELTSEMKTMQQKALQGIQFDNGKATILSSSFPLLRQLANTLEDHPEYMMEIQCHTDNIGDQQMNLELSEKRAMAIRKFLIDAGVSSTQLTAKGYGDTMPVADNITKEGRTLNRRIELIVSFNFANSDAYNSQEQ
ncbi:MAG: DUF5723 family protein [Paludibacteraceae bacterium]|nr:DUF5723 family protein [Paludibacteraceae bacterium]